MAMISVATAAVPDRDFTSRLVLSVLCVFLAVSSTACLGKPEPPETEDATERVKAAYASKESGFVVTVAGRVVRTLADDEVGTRHQRFIVALASGQTLLVSHNIDLAPRVPIRTGDSLTVRVERPRRRVALDSSRPRRRP